MMGSAVPAVIRSSVRPDGAEPLKLLLPEGRISSRFGPRAFAGRTQDHSGVDIVPSTPGWLLWPLPEAGLVLTEVNCAGGLLACCIGRRHMVVFGHLSAAVRGPSEPGRRIAIWGDSGLMSTGPHLHVSVLRDGEMVDPERFSWQRYGCRPQPVWAADVSWRAARPSAVEALKRPPTRR